MSTLVVGKVIMMPAMRRGLCGYADETVLLSQGALKDMSETVHGIPVVIDHQVIDSGNVERLTVGRVADMHYDEETDNWNVHFVVDDQEAVDKLKSGWGVSTAYRITESGPGGRLNNVPYDREVLGGSYDHLAIVESPRYEMAKNPIFYNSKETKTGANMISKLWRMIRQEVKINQGEELFVMVGDKEMSLNDLTAAIHEADMKKNSSKVIMNANDQVIYNGETMTVENLIGLYNCRNAEAEKENEKEDVKKENEKEVKKENEKEDVKKENEAEDKKEVEAEKKDVKKENEAEDKEVKKENEIEAEKKKENEIEAEKKKENEAKEEDLKEKKENSNFNELRSIKENGITADVSQWQSLSDQLEAGRKLFGSK